MDAGIINVYGNKLRVRVCGLYWQENRLLLARHHGLSEGGFWAPPGGGLEFGESVAECLKKEFREETGLQITVGRFLFGCEFIRDPLHAVELYFEVTAAGGLLQKGDDPELPLIEEVRLMTPEEITGIPPGSLHGIFRLVSSPQDLHALTGFFRI